MKWTDLPVHVIDFEGSVRSGIVEFGVATLEGGVLTAVHSRACRPRAPVAAAELMVHGLADHALAAAEPFETEWSRFAALRERGLFAAHFCATENALLRAVWPCPRLSPDFLEPGRLRAEWGPWIDTGRLAVEILPAGAVAQLSEVVAALGLRGLLDEAAQQFCAPARRHFHCAGYDAIAAALVLLKLARDEHGEPWTVARVVTASTADPQAREARGQARWF